MTLKQLVQNTLSQDAFLLVNKKILKKLDNANAALILSSLISKYQYFENRGELQDGYFFNTKEMLKNELGFSEKVTLSAEKKLISIGFISTKLQGLPRKKYYTINWDKIASILNEDVVISQPIVGIPKSEPIKPIKTPAKVETSLKPNNMEQLEKDKYILELKLSELDEFGNRFNNEKIIINDLIIKNENGITLTKSDKQKVEKIQELLILETL